MERLHLLRSCCDDHAEKNEIEFVTLALRFSRSPIIGNETVTTVT